MITLMSSIYDKIFRLLAFVIEELEKAQFSWEVPPCDPDLERFPKFSNFFALTAMLTVTSLTSPESFITVA
jgi:hypothetical protein